MILPLGRQRQGTGRNGPSRLKSGRAIVFTARDAGREEAWSTDLDLFEAPIDASSPPRKLTTDNRATDTAQVAAAYPARWKELLGA